MRIERPGRIERTAPSKRAGSTSAAGGFSGLLDSSDATATARTGGSLPVALVGSLTALQEADDAAGRRSRGLQRGHDLLDMLEGVQRGLVLGTLNVTQMQNIAARVRSHERPDDPVLANLLDEIELRVEVELAKYGR